MLNKVSFVELKEFLEALDKSDFQIGDTFWLDDIKFEVIDMREPLKKVKTGA